MKEIPIYRDASERFCALFHASHTHAAYAPGRFEILGNHTDYNEGFVLSAATNFGTVALAAPRDDERCILTSSPLSETAEYAMDSLCPTPGSSWANYVWGVLTCLREVGNVSMGCNILVSGDIPLGSGLASSAALEISTGLALGALYGIELSPLDLARIGQRAEQEFVGANTGLMDQISSLHGEHHHLVMTDFRSLDVESLPFVEDGGFVMCDTGVSHALGDGQYNERRKHCEEAARFFNSVLDHEVHALRDVSRAEWQKHHAGMDDTRARRCAHPIGENERVLKGRDLLGQEDLEGLGVLMYESHESSANYFENSCPELDFVVSTARRVPGVLGARLSGGGFGGSAVILTRARYIDSVMHAVTSAYGIEYGRACTTRRLVPSAGATLLDL